MERLLLTLVVLIVVLAAASLTELPGLEARPDYREVVIQNEDWVRTTNGWERATWSDETMLIAAEPAPLAQLDPRIVGTLQLLVSLAALLALAKATPVQSEAC